MAATNGRSGRSGAGGGMTTGVLLAGAVSLLALPSAVLAFSTRFEPPAPRTAGAAQDDSVPTDTAAGMTRPIALRSLAKGPLYPFTPAGTPNRPNRSVTVAVRVDPLTVQAISVRGRRLADGDPVGATPLTLAPTAFNLGVSRGYRTFAPGLVPAGTEVKKIEMPDLAAFRANGTAGPAPSRLSPRIVIDEKLAPGRAPRTFAGESDDLVDVGGSYRLTRNINVTAGVRYSQDRERLRPLTDGNSDNQAVYVGTQFRF
jgi:hypothetical protein